MKNNEKGAFFTYDKEINASDISKHVVGLQRLANIDVVSLADGFSHDVSTDSWDKLIGLIEDKYEDYDGFIITSGTDTLAYLSSAMSFAMRGLGKPVVITGARGSIYEIRTDAKMNLINSVLTATADLSGVFVVFGSKIISGARATKSNQISINAFSTFNKKDFSVTDDMLSSFDFNLNNSHEVIRRHNNKPSFKRGFSSDLVCITVTPTFNIQYLYEVVKSGAKAIILQTFGSGNLPKEFLPFLEQMKEEEIVVIVATHCAEGSTSVGVYERGEALLALNLIEAYDMTIECVYAKCMWMLGQNIPYADFKFLFQTSMVGEIDKRMNDAIIEREHTHCEDE